MDGPRIKNVGGTSGGLAEFLLGIALLAGGGYLFLDNVVVTSGWRSLGGRSSFGLALVATAIGVAVLFFRGRSIVGWLLAVGGLAAIFVGVFLDLHAYFRPASLTRTLGMLVMMAAGIGLLVRAVRPHGRSAVEERAEGGG